MVSILNEQLFIINCMCVRDSSENTFLIRPFGEEKKIEAHSPTLAVTPK
jgi:hypothetical protein